MPHRLHGLYAITDDQQTDLLSEVAAALSGGVRVLQYRNKTQDAQRRYREAHALRILTHDHGALLLINDDVDLALQIGADGVHLGQSDLNLAAARHQLGSDRLIGVTCHDQLTLAEAAVAGGADYVAFGALFPSRTKPQTRRCSLQTLTQACQTFNVPVVAIGGITLDNVAQPVQAGVAAVAVIHDLWSRVDISAHAAAYLRAFSSRESSSSCR